MDKNLSGQIVISNQAKNAQYQLALQKIGTNKFKCLRCQMVNSCSIYSLAQDEFYCPECIGLGRITNCDYAITYPELNYFPENNEPLTWKGQLTEKQSQVSQTLIETWKKKENRLVWAVTGSGKTEMLFPLLEQAIINKDRIVIAAPRIDVCNELYPRIKSAFEKTSVCLSHSQTKNEFFYSQILICTVHQLLKFKNTFDLLIIDECDSFPLNGDLMLKRAISNAGKDINSTIFLSATPSEEIQQLKLPISLLNRRFHGHDLPVPKFKLIWKDDSKKLNNTLLTKIRKLFQKQQPFLLFVSSIKESEKLSNLLKRKIPQLKQTFVHSKDKTRTQKVEQFRQNQWQALVTTTILERGVSFKNVDVLIWNADSKRFDAQTLVQIAGRAGRSKEHFDNQVIFYGEKFTNEIFLAIKQIRKLNHD